MPRTFCFALLALAIVLAACGGSGSAPSESGSPGGGVDQTLGGSAETAALLGPLRLANHGDWDDIFERRILRALVAPSRTNFFLDNGVQRGIAADALVELEKHLNATLDVGSRKMQVVAIPVNRGDLISLLADGRGEIALGNITITPERQEFVDFTVPTSKPIDELVVTGPESPSLEGLDDLAGQSVYIRPSSSYWASLEKLNAQLTGRGLEPIELEPADEYLETEDILEMVNAGLIPITIADSYFAQFWSDVFPNLVVHENLKVAEGRLLGWAVRKDATGLKEKLDPWIEANRQGALLGNMLIKRYLKDNVWVKNANAEQDRQRFRSMLELFSKYGTEYGLEPLLLAAQGFQESGLDQSKRSRVGAVGVMQILPKTARDPAVGITDIDKLESNIHAGTKYVRHLIDVYFDDENIDDLNRLLFAFAGYNAGPNRINRLRQVAADEGLDPNVWFRNVEFVVAREVGREPVQYVSNIYKYFLAYQIMLGRELERASG